MVATTKISPELCVPIFWVFDAMHSTGSNFVFLFVKLSKCQYNVFHILYYLNCSKKNSSNSTVWSTYMYMQHFAFLLPKILPAWYQIKLFIKSFQDIIRAKHLYDSFKVKFVSEGKYGVLCFICFWIFGLETIL